ncbi:MAG: DUF948 domain-containing protein [Cyanobacteria bacterium P01_F01_bin.150]
MTDPLMWLEVSAIFVSLGVMSLLIAAIPVLYELANATRSAEKLFDTLNRELPPTLEAIRLTGSELTELKDDLSEGVQSAGRVVQQVDQGVTVIKQQANQIQATTRGSIAGLKAAWKVLRGKK